MKTLCIHCVERQGIKGEDKEAEEMETVAGEGVMVAGREGGKEGKGRNKAEEEKISKQDIIRDGNKQAESWETGAGSKGTSRTERSAGERGDNKANERDRDDWSGARRLRWDWNKAGETKDGRGNMDEIKQNSGCGWWQGRAGWEMNCRVGYFDGGQTWRSHSDLMHGNYWLRHSLSRLQSLLFLHIGLSPLSSLCLTHSAHVPLTSHQLLTVLMSGPRLHLFLITSSYGFTSSCPTVLSPLITGFLHLPLFSALACLWSLSLPHPSSHSALFPVVRDSRMDAHMSAAC